MPIVSSATFSLSYAKFGLSLSSLVFTRVYITRTLRKSVTVRVPNSRGPLETSNSF